MKKTTVFLLLLLLSGGVVSAQDTTVTATVTCGVPGKPPCPVILATTIKKGGVILMPTPELLLGVTVGDFKTQGLSFRAMTYLSTQQRYTVTQRITMDNRYMSQEYQDSHFEVDQQLDIPAATPWRYGAGVQLTQMGLKGLGYSFGGVNEYQLTYLEFIPAQVNYEISPLLHVGVGAGLSRLVRADLNGQVVNDLSADGYNGWEHNLFLEFGVGNSTHGFQGGLRTQLRNTYLNREQAAYGAVQVYAGYRLGQNTKRN